MKYTLFTIQDKQFAIEISQISEVVRIETWSPLPDGPNCLDGIINLRGEIVPLVNLRTKFGLERGGENKVKRVIVASTGVCDFGIVVDDVLGVKTLETIDISPSDKLLEEVKYLKCVGKDGDQLIPVLDVGELLSDSEKARVECVCDQT